MYEVYFLKNPLKSDCTQVVFGLLVDTEGMPLAFDVYPDNTYEAKTMPEAISKLKKKFNIRRVQIRKSTVKLRIYIFVFMC